MKFARFYAAFTLLMATPVLAQAEDFTILANTYVSGGGSAIVYGNVIAKTYASTGNGSTVHGDFRSGDVLTLGDGATVNGNAESKQAGTAAANTLVTGSLVTGGVGTMGATARVKGNFISGLDGTIGANAILGGNWDVGAGSVATASASSNKVNGDAVDTDTAYLNTVKATIDSDMIAATNDLIGTKAALYAMESTEPTLSPTFVTDGTLFAGVYNAASWSTTAGTTLTLDGQGQDNAMWVFNIDDILSFGAGSIVELFNVGDNAQVFWNIGSVSSPGGYASVGAGADILGIIIAEDYVSVGADATVMHASGAYGNCAGIYSTTSYVSIGANAVVGGAGCLSTSTSPPVRAQDANCSIIYAGQDEAVGSVCVTLDDDTAYLDYFLENDWTMSEAHAWIGDNLGDMPQNNEGSPQIGLFPYTATGLDNVTEYSVAIPVSELQVNLDTFCSADVFVAAHGVVQKIEEGTSGGSWASYFTFTNDFCPQVEIVDPQGCYNTFMNATGQSRFGMLSNTLFAPIDTVDTTSAWLVEFRNTSTNRGVLSSDTGAQPAVGNVSTSNTTDARVVTFSTGNELVLSANIYYGPAGSFQNVSPLEYGYHADNLNGASAFSMVLPLMTATSYDMVVHAVVCAKISNE
jgi:hypothetical protein